MKQFATTSMTMGVVVSIGACAISQVPQYFQFGHIFNLEMHMSEVSSLGLGYTVKDLSDAQPYFSHLVKQVSSQFAYDGEDGTFYDIDCHQLILTHPGEKEDSFFNDQHFLFHTEPERDDRVPVQKLSELQTEIVRKNLAGACDTLDQEVWQFTFCAGGYFRQQKHPELVKKGIEFESFSLGQFDGLDQLQNAKLKTLLEGKDLFINPKPDLSALNPKKEVQQPAVEQLTADDKQQLLSHDSLASLRFKKPFSRIPKLKFTLFNTFSKQEKLVVVINEKYGLKIYNYSPQQQFNHLNKKLDQNFVEEDGSFYQDIDLELGKSTDQLLVMTHKQKVYLFANNLTSGDCIYEGDLPAEYIQDQFQIQIDQDYTSLNLQEEQNQQNLPVDDYIQINLIETSISQEIQRQLFTQSIQAVGQQNNNIGYDSVSEPLDHSKYYFVDKYSGGTACGGGNAKQPVLRNTTVVYFCDQYAFRDRKQLRILDVKEPNFCQYQITIATRYLCPSLNQFKPATPNLASEANTEKLTLSRHVMKHPKIQQIHCVFKDEIQ